MLNNKGFDLWAKGYDKDVNLSEESDAYPFAGYKDLLNYIYNEVREKDCGDILDIGFGTGILTSKLYENGYNITGVDFSESMIDIAKEKMPKATLLKWDFSKGIPDDIKNYTFDYIISTYAIHHLTDEEKVNFIKLLIPMLNDNGVILFGDVSFEKRDDLDKSKEKYKRIWDNEEFYFIGEEIKKSLGNECYCEYIKISHCAGVLIISAL